MKALVLERTGRRAVLLLPGGEIRTVRARKGWETGMEVRVKPYPLRKKRTKFNLRAVFYPLAACAAALLIVFAGLNRLGGDHIDRQHPVQPLSSGSPAATHTNAPEPTGSPTSMPAANTPQPTKEAVQSTPRPTPEPAANTPGTVPAVQPTPQQELKICDECGQTGHGDDACPYEVCDECGAAGHDDDDCPEQICDECGQTGHDDDHCPDEHKGSCHDD